MNNNYYLEAKPKLIEGTSPLAIFVFICGLFASQRFSLDGLNIYICILPYMLSLYYFLSNKLEIALSLIVISIFLLSDNGGGVYSETPTILKYMIYVSGLLVLGYFSKPKIDSRNLLFLIILSAMLIITTLFSQLAVFDPATFRRDVLAFIILSLVLISKGEVELSLPILFAASFGFLIGELLNTYLFFNYINDYMNYNSLKAFIIFPFLYAVFIKKTPLIATGLFFLTILVLFNYGSRMLFLTLFLFLLISFVLDKSKPLRSTLFLIFFVSAFFIINFFEFSTFDTESSRYKVINFFFYLTNLIVSLDITNTYEALDLVRFRENQLFFSRPLYEVIFGSGLGSGLADTQGLLGFVGYFDTAFTVEELNNSVYFNLHDFWTDFGLRFGLITVVFITYLVSIKQILFGQKICGILFGILLFNAFFSTAGMIFMALIIKFYPSGISSVQSNQASDSL